MRFLNILGEALSQAWIIKRYDSKMRFQNINEWGVLKDEISEHMKQNLKSNQSCWLQIFSSEFLDGDNLQRTF